MISIIIPVYNTEAYLDKCIESIVKQSYSDLEIIIIDDCSTDNSKAIIDRWAKMDSRIHPIYNQKNQGVCHSRNVGMALARGEYIAFVDSDDFITPILFESLLDMIETFGADIAKCSCFHYINGNAEEINFLPELSETKLICDGLEALKLCLPCIGDHPLNMVVWNSLFRKDILLDSDRNLILFDSKFNYCEDVFWYAQILKQAKSVVLSNESLYYYRCNRMGSASDRILQSTQHTISAVSAYMEIYRMLKADNISARNSLQRSLQHKIIGMQVSSKCKDQKVFSYCTKGFLRSLIFWVYLEKNTYSLRWAFRKTVQYFLIRIGLFHLLSDRINNAQQSESY